ncbi:hypothetical protein EYF80_039925 [Liparis tanakae]|uniref:Uncharacterized protein n=1 Tax=Liparis tanakae TaxID=230148 RepID=A0A4Z2GAB1_9TELE|nr:hypothetical protein EYF80_039925 [Liparis tanakae]
MVPSAPPTGPVDVNRGPAERPCSRANKHFLFIRHLWPHGRVARLDPDREKHVFDFGDSPHVPRGPFRVDPLPFLLVTCILFTGELSVHLTSHDFIQPRFVDPSVQS